MLSGCPLPFAPTYLRTMTRRQGIKQRRPGRIGFPDEGGGSYTPYVAKAPEKPPGRTVGRFQGRAL